MIHWRPGAVPGGFGGLLMRYARSFSRCGLFVILAATAASACGDSQSVSLTAAGGGSGDGSGGAGSSAAAGGAPGGGGSGAGTGTAGDVIVGGAGSGVGGAVAGSGGVASGGGTGGAVSTGGTGGSGVIAEVPCLNQTYACGDTVDNDGDGLVDWKDPDCLGPCDNTEDSFYGGIPGQPGPSCTVDCYWDANSGSGDDECNWNHKCDPHEDAGEGHPEPNSKCPYDPGASTPGTPLSCDELYVTQTPTCESFCGPLTPNGCDCFGCCELPAGSGQYVWLGSEDEATGQGSCKLGLENDPAKCEPCLPVAACLNGCEPCELCIGKDTLPPECFPDGSGGAGGGGTMQCPDGIQPCGLPGQPDCPAGHYCITGCCQEIVDPK